MTCMIKSRAISDSGKSRARHHDDRCARQIVTFVNKLPPAILSSPGIMAAQPSDLRTLLHSLVNPASNEAYVRDQATLSDLFKQPEFFIALQGLAADRSLPQQERLLASVITGRELKTKWRSKTLVPEARKPEVRQLLFSFLEEGDTGVSGMLLAATEADCPTDR